jgi:hypothetical protein
MRRQAAARTADAHVARAAVGVGLRLQLGLDDVERAGRDARDEPGAGAGWGCTLGSALTHDEAEGGGRTEHAIVEAPSVRNGRHVRAMVSTGEGVDGQRPEGE